MPQMREWVSLSRVRVIDRFPFGLRTLAIIKHLESGGVVPPIHVQLNEHGQLIVLDGRHRWLAHKMLERRIILVRYGMRTKYETQQNRISLPVDLPSLK